MNDITQGNRKISKGSIAAEVDATSFWDKFDKTARLLSLVAIPVVLGIGGWWIEDSLSKRSVEKDYVSLAVSILSKPREEGADADLRGWAVKLLNEHSQVKLDEATIQKLTGGEISLPVAAPSEFNSIIALPPNDARRAASRPIGKLDVLKNGIPQSCTALLIDNDRILTSDYCVAAPPAEITFQPGFWAQGQTAGPKFKVDPTTSVVDKVNGYAILKVEGTPGNQYGFLRIASEKPEVNESLFIAHHANGLAQSFSNPCKVVKVSTNNTEFEHNCDTGGGAGGAPLIRVSDYTVVGVHYMASSATRQRVAKRTDVIKTLLGLEAESFDQPQSSRPTAK